MAPTGETLLRAGPLALAFDQGQLRWIRHGPNELLRGIYVGVRDPDWGTVPGRIDRLVVDAGSDRFRIRFRSRHVRGPLHFEWEADIEGDAAGAVQYAMEGDARQTFAKNRIGICVLHPTDPCAGRACEVERVDGEIVRGVFPRFVSPHQPFLGIRAIRHEVEPGLVAEVSFTGDVFEMEDQRNWSDASYKTYSTPLSLPYPAVMPAGTHVSQSVTLRLRGSAKPRPAPIAGDGSVRLDVGSGRGLTRPRFGFGPSTRQAPFTQAERKRLQQLRLDHMRVDLRPGTTDPDPALAVAADVSRAIDVPLHVALFLSEDAEADLATVAAAVRDHKPRVALWLLFRDANGTTSFGLVDQARARLAALSPAARFGGGTDGNFVELNRLRPSAASLDQVSFALTPQAHATDDATLIENLDSLPSIAESARAFVGSCPLALSPVTLQARRRRPAGSPAGEEDADPRQATLLGAAWTAGLVTAAAESGFASVSLFEPTGAAGIVDGDTVHPLYHVLAELAEAETFDVARTGPGQPCLRALSVGRGERTRTLVVNLSRAAQVVHLTGLRFGAQAVRLSESLLDEATRSPDVFRARAGEPITPRRHGYTLELEPQEIVILDSSRE